MGEISCEGYVDGSVATTIPGHNCPGYMPSQEAQLERSDTPQSDREPLHTSESKVDYEPPEATTLPQSSPVVLPYRQPSSIGFPFPCVLCCGQGYELCLDAPSEAPSFDYIADRTLVSSGLGWARGP